MRYRLIVMRHAKSDWNSAAEDDHSRPLNKRGRKDAPRIAAKLCELGWQPDVILSSDAMRTQETLERMASGFEDPPPNFELYESLYHAGLPEIIEVVQMVHDDVQTVLVLGHNPGWQSAVWQLTGESREMTTANAALLELEADNWTAAINEAGSWQVTEFLRPKEI